MQRLLIHKDGQCPFEILTIFTIAYVAMNEMQRHSRMESR